MREWLVSVSAHQALQLGMRNSREHGGIGDLVAVEVQDRKHRAIGGGVEEFIGVPAGCQRSSLSLAIANDASDDQVGIVEGSAKRMDERIAKFATLVNGSGRLRRYVAGYAIGPTELAEQALDAVPILLDVRIDFGVGAFKVGIGDQSRTAVSRTDDVHHVEVALANDAVPVDVEKIETGSSSPVAEQAWLHVIERERALKQWIVFEIDLSDGEVVSCAPVGVHLCQQIGAQEGRLLPLFRSFINLASCVPVTPSKPSSSVLTARGDSSHKATRRRFTV